MLNGGCLAQIWRIIPGDLRISVHIMRKTLDY